MTTATRTSRILCTSLAALATLTAAVSLPAWASGATLGSTRVDTSSNAGVFCGGFPSCALAQTSLPGGLTKASFTGKIRSWRVNIDSGGSLQLLVLRKNSDGSFSAITGSAVKAPATSGVHRFGAKLKIKKGEFIGLNLLDEDVTIHTLSAPDPALLDGFLPAFGIAGRQFPDEQSSGGMTELLLSAHLKRH
jgi:hypothetical protein